MCKRLMVFLALLVGVMAMMGTEETMAFPRVGGWGVSCPIVNGVPKCSLYCDALLKGVGNPDVNPTSVDCILENITMQVLCANHGDQDGGEGRVFTFDGTTTETVLINWDSFTSNGQAVADVYFSDCSFYNKVKDLTDVCINPNWYIIPPSGWTPGWQEGDECSENSTGGTFTVLETDVAIITYGDDGYYYAVTGHCTLNTDPTNPGYSCTETDRGRCADSTCSNIL